MEEITRSFNKEFKGINVISSPFPDAIVTAAKICKKLKINSVTVDFNYCD